MKIREIERTAHVAWSPAAVTPVYLACGTAAQHIELDSNGTCALELFELNLRSDDFVLKPTAAVQTSHRYNKLVWGPFGDEGSNGTIAAGSDNGLLEIYSASSILAGETATAQTSQRHAGSINALDFNPFQSYLLASGSSESEIFMWDLQKPGEYSAFDMKSHPTDGVTTLSWNKHVQHILASAFSQRILIWDLRKNEAIQKLAESSRARYKSVAWNPEISTQLAVASEDDHLPVIQVWDVRYAGSPIRSLEGHSSGVLSVSWCQQDPNLLVSCGKDGRVILWNPNSASPNGEIVSELKADQWCFDVQFCPRNPALVSVADFNSKIGVYSIMGGASSVEQQLNHAAFNIADSFPGMDAFAMPQPTQQLVEIVTRPPTRPPKWMKTPCRPSFSFGGKLVTGEDRIQEGRVHQFVKVHQVTTDPEMVAKSAMFANAFSSGDMLPYCDAKISTSETPEQANMWRLIRSYFVQDPRHDQIQVLGYSQEAVAAKVDAVLGKSATVESVTNLMNGLGTQETIQDGLSHLHGADVFDALSIGSRRTPDVVTTAAVPDVASRKTPELDSTRAIHVTTDDSSDGLIGQSLVTGNLVAAVDLCAKDGRWADALILAMAGGQELLLTTQQKYFKSVTNDISRLIGGIVLREWSNVAAVCDLSSWMEVVASAIMFAMPEDVQLVCQTLADRLEPRRDLKNSIADASLCYILAGNLDALVRCWESQQSTAGDHAALQELIEQLMVIKRALQLRGQNNVSLPERAADKIGNYANLLASEGQLELALMLLGYLSENDLPALRTRLEYAAGHRQPVRSVTSRRASGPAKSVARQPSLPYQQPVAPQQNLYTPAPSQPSLPYQPASQPQTYQPQQQPFVPAPFSHSASPFSQPAPPAARPPSRAGFGPGAPAPPVPGAAVPPPPAVSATPATASAGPATRRARVPDPSVGSAYQGSFGGPAQSQMFDPSSHQPQVNEFTPGIPAQNQFGDQYQPPKPATPQPPAFLREEKRGWNDPPELSSVKGARSKPRRPVPNEIPSAPFQPSYGQSFSSAPHGAQQTGYPSQPTYGYSDYGAVTQQPSGYQQQATATYPPSQPAAAYSQPPAAGYQQPSTYGQPVQSNSYGSPVGKPPAAQSYSSSAYQQPPVQQPAAAPVQPSYGAMPQQPAVNQQPLPAAPAPYAPQPPVPSGHGYNPTPPPLAQAPQYSHEQAVTHAFATQEPPSAAPQVYNQVYQQPSHQMAQFATEAEYASEAVEKPAMPAESAALHSVLEQLRERVTSAVATAPPMKRKLDEVARKMQILYDKLRMNELSPTSLQMLHQLVEAVQHGDYASALGLHQQIVGSGSYGEVGAFMPSLKVLLQLAAQNGLYLR